MKVKIKKLNEKAVMPKKAHATDAGFDLVATSRATDRYGNIVYGTGLAVEIPEGHVGLIFPRSSICKVDMLLSNAVGVIDSGYRGEVMAKFKPSWQFDTAAIPFQQDSVDVSSIDDDSGCYIYRVGDRIGQLVILPIPEIEFEETDKLTATDRGTGGYGSTGV